MKTHLLFFACAIFATVLQGAEPAKLSDADSAGLMQKARAVQAAFETGDADGVIRLTHPAVPKLMGPRDAMGGGEDALQPGEVWEDRMGRAVTGLRRYAGLWR